MHALAITMNELNCNTKKLSKPEDNRRVIPFFPVDGTSSIQFSIPKTLIQTVINKAVADRDWKRLHLLFLGGGGEKRYKKGSGGLATGCDASSVPLEEVIRNDLPVLGKFINILLDHKANANPPKGGKSPLDVAMELGKIDVASILIERNATSGAGTNTSERRKVKENHYIEGLELNMWVIMCFKSNLWWVECKLP